MPSRTYLELAYEQALWKEVRNRLLSIMSAAKGGQTEVLAPSAPYDRRFVTLQVAGEMLDEIMTKERALGQELSQWQWVRLPPAPVTKSSIRRER